MLKNDKKHAREQVILENPEKSDRELAKIAGCSAMTINRDRKELIKKGLLKRHETILDSIDGKQATEKASDNIALPPLPFNSYEFREKALEILKPTYERIEKERDEKYGTWEDKRTREEIEEARKRVEKEREEFLEIGHDKIMEARKSEPGEIYLATLNYPCWSDTYHFIKKDGELKVRVRSIRYSPNMNGNGGQILTSETILEGGGMKSKKEEDITWFDEMTEWSRLALEEYKKAIGQ